MGLLIPGRPLEALRVIHGRGQNLKVAVAVHQDGKTDLDPGHAGFNQERPRSLAAEELGIIVFVIAQQEIVYLPNLPGMQNNPGPLAAGAVRVFQNDATMGVQVVQANFQHLAIIPGVGRGPGSYRNTGFSAEFFTGDLIAFQKSPMLIQTDNFVAVTRSRHLVHQTVEQERFRHYQGNVQGPSIKGLNQGRGIGVGGIIRRGDKIQGPLLPPGKGRHGRGAPYYDSFIVAGIEFTYGAAGFQGCQKTSSIRADKADFSRHSLLFGRIRWFNKKFQGFGTVGLVNITVPDVPEVLYSLLDIQVQTPGLELTKAVIEFIQ